MPRQYPDAVRSEALPLIERLVASFPELDRSSLDCIVQSGVQRVVPPGTVMFSAQSPCTGFPLILAGTVRVLQRYPNGRELQLYRVKAGEFCLASGSSLLGETEYAATGIAETDVELIVLPAEEFHSLLARDDRFRRQVFGLFSDRLAGLMQVVEAVAYQKLDQRLATLLLRRSEDGSEIHATHQALADELGSVREIVSRLLRGFEDRGWVDLGRERIRVTDRPALAGLATG